MTEKGFKGPMPTPVFEQQVAKAVDLPLVYQFSGEITAAKKYFPLGSPRKAGQIPEVFFSVGASGKDDDETLSIELDILINGTSCLTTGATIAHVSGEASQQKTTVQSGDGITEAVMDGDNDSYDPGDVITGVLSLTRTASPTTEMANACVVVPLNPT